MGGHGVSRLLCGRPDSRSRPRRPVFRSGSRGLVLSARGRPERPEPLAQPTRAADRHHAQFRRGGRAGAHIHERCRRAVAPRRAPSSAHVMTAPCHPSIHPSIQHFSILLSVPNLRVPLVGRPVQSSDGQSGLQRRAPVHLRQRGRDHALAAINNQSTPSHLSTRGNPRRKRRASSCTYKRAPRRLGSSGPIVVLMSRLRAIAA